MRKLDEIYELIYNSSMILVIGNNSKTLLDSLCNLIYKNYSFKKMEYHSTKGVLKKLSVIKQKVNKIDYDLKKVQMSSSKNNQKIFDDFGTLRAYICENKSKLLFKTNLSQSDYISKVIDSYQITQILPQYHTFDLIILIKHQVNLV